MSDAYKKPWRKTHDAGSEIRRLDETLVNRIAAGEVIERPASVIKELIENAVDAGASRIDIATSGGGKTLMRVSDDGNGMTAENLQRAVERHCTSKIGDDLMDIRTLGFRGEALPSIGSVARLSVSSRAFGSNQSWKINLSGGKLFAVEPVALGQGTVAEVCDLFFATPARLKFLKTDQAESNAITDVFKRMALAFPNIRFSIGGDDRSSLDYPATTVTGRIEQVSGKAFLQNAIEIDAEREGVCLSGLTSVPTYHRGNAFAQYFFVNGRPVRDKTLLSAARGAYMDFLPRGKHPLLVLFLELEPYLVDVNVHPAKAEVRFRDPGLVRGLIVGAIRQALTENGPLSSKAGAEAMIKAFRYDGFGASTNGGSRGHTNAVNWAQPLESHFNQNSVNAASEFAENQVTFTEAPRPGARVEPDQTVSINAVQYPLGAAVAQLHKNYIISQTGNGLVIVDQHAAHERIVYEKLKKGMHDGIAGQFLLIPDIVNLCEEDINRLLEFSDALAKFGLEIEAFGYGAVAVRATPALLGEVNSEALLRDLCDEIAEWDTADTLSGKLEYVAATIACHGSVRSGRLLNAEEMNALLRQMEETPNSGQCNHGRPTFVALDLKDIERLFGR